MKQLLTLPMAECADIYALLTAPVFANLNCSNYVDQATAVAQNLTFASGNTLILRADSKTTLSASGPGRNSVRIHSNKKYTTHVAV